MPDSTPHDDPINKAITGTDLPPSGRAVAAAHNARYTAPELVVYGSLRTVTARVGSKGKKDGSGSRRTGF
jgi:hypothetical protein